ncbi:MAG: NAD(P)/FAD-dependent oxidoreductase [Vampirovibrionia bacterium]
MKIAVIGGGISGVILTRLLQEKGHESHLYEKQSQLGGLCSSKTIDGYLYDLGGGHRLQPKNKKVLKYLLDLLGKSNWNKNVRNARIYYKGSYVKYPFEHGLNDLPQKDNFECLLGFINAHYEKKYLHKSQPQNFYDWILHRFGKGIANKFLIPYNQKTWNYNLKHLGIGCVKPTIPLPPIEDVIKSSIGLDADVDELNSTFYYPKNGGMQTLIDSLAEGLKNVHLSEPVLSLEKLSNGWIINGDDKFDDVVITIPVQEVPYIIKNTPPFVTATLNSLWYNGLVTVMVGLNKPFDHDYSWLYLPHKEHGPVNCVSFLSNYSKNNVPEGAASLVAEITYKAKTLPDNSDSVKVDVIDSLDSLNIIDKNDVVVCDASFFQYAYPVYGLKYSEFIQIINNYLNEMKLKRFGRFATHSYYDVDDILELAFDFVDKWY